MDCVYPLTKSEYVYIDDLTEETGFTFVLGSNGTEISTCYMMDVVQKQMYYKSATNKLLEFFFSNDVLATHSRTGIHLKPGLDPIIISDIIEYVSKMFIKTAKEVCRVISSKCNILGDYRRVRNKRKSDTSLQEQTLKRRRVG